MYLLVSWSYIFIVEFVKYEGVKLGASEIWYNLLNIQKYKIFQKIEVTCNKNLKNLIVKYYQLLETP